MARGGRIRKRVAIGDCQVMSDMVVLVDQTLFLMTVFYQTICMWVIFPQYVRATKGPNVAKQYNSEATNIEITITT